MEEEEGGEEEEEEEDDEEEEFLYTNSAGTKSEFNSLEENKHFLSLIFHKVLMRHFQSGIKNVHVHWNYKW